MMASLDKLLKAFETVRGAQSSLEKTKTNIADDANLRLNVRQSDHDVSIASSSSGGSFSYLNPLPSQSILLKKEQPLTVRDKLLLCQSVSDSVIIGSKSNSDTQKLLSIGIESLLLLVDDENPDVRMNADEALNRIIRSLCELHSSKLLLEFFKEIKKNGRTRSLRSSLSKFAVLCRYIRPQKCRAYIQNLIPHLTKIARRQEEPLLETLTSFFEKVLPFLGHFTNDNEIRGLMKSLLHNAKSVSASVRRSAASCLLLLCQYSRRPRFFFVWLLETVLQIMIPVSEDSLSNEVIGGLLIIRYLAPHFPYLCSLPQETIQQNIDKQGAAKNNECLLTLDHVAQVYELCIHYCSSSESSIVTSSLEGLQVLLQHPCSHLLSILLSPEGITRSRIHQMEDKRILSSRTASQVSIVSSLNEEEVTLDAPDLKSFVEIAGGDGEKSVEEHGTSVESSPRTYPIDSDSATATGESLPNDSKASLYNLLSEDPHHTYDNDEDDESDIYATIEVGCLIDASTPLDSSQINLTQACPTLKRRRKIHDLLPAHEEEEIKSWNPNQEINKRLGNIGSFQDEDIPLKYLARFLCSSFLLSGWPSSLISDQTVKISIKVLALNCFVLVVSFQPSLMAQMLFIEEPSEDTAAKPQLMDDVLLFECHPDPQIKSTVALLVGLFIHSSLSGTNGQHDSFGRPRLALLSLLATLENLLKQDSSIAIRGTLNSLGVCLPELLRSSHIKSTYPVITQLIATCHHSYWLVKVDLVELLSNIPLNFIDHFESSSTHIGFSASALPSFSCSGKRFSHRLVPCVFLPLLGDPDHRVRSAAASALQRLGQQSSMQKDIVSAFFEDCICWNFCPASFGVTSSSALTDVPEDASLGSKSEGLVSGLSRLVKTLSTHLLVSANKFMKLGCLEALCLLSEKFKPVDFPYVWGCHILPKPGHHQSCKNPHVGLVSLVLSLSSEHSLSSDLAAQQNILTIAANWLSGRASYTLSIQKEKEAEKSAPWTILGNSQLRTVAEGFVRHLLRILNIYYHVLEETPPGARNVLMQPGPVSAFSPIKRGSRVEAEKEKSRNHSPGRSEKTADSEEKERKSSKSGFVGVFVHLSEYLKLYEVVKSAHINYKMCLDDVTKQKLTGLLEVSFTALGTLLEMASIVEFGHLVEELLRYFKVTSSLLPAPTISCGQQLLNCLFGSNRTKIASPSVSHAKPPSENSEGSERKPSEKGLYRKVFANPISQLQKDFDALLKGNQTPEAFTFLKRKGSSLNFNSQSKPMDRSSLSSYIRLFEPLVIKALKLYTVSSDVKLQRSVLELLIHLVEIRVNYCLLDSEQIFIGYIIKQFEYIEEGQIKKAEELIPSVFKFLVLLSYERHHSKSIIGVPKIIQLCDGLLASGQPPLSHCILALRPLVTDLFFERGQSSGTDQKELETQKEVLCSMLLRLAHYHQVLHLISLVLVTSQRVDKERWRKLSYQVLDTLLSSIAKLKVNINSKPALTAVEEVLRSICPTVLLPPDAILKAMLSSPCDIQTTEEVERWIGGALLLLRVLICHAQVDAILSRLDHLGLSLDFIRSTSDMSSSLNCSIHSSVSPKRLSCQRICQMSSSSESASAFFRDPLNVASPSIDPGHSFARFLLEMILVSTGELGSFQCNKFQGHIFTSSHKEGQDAGHSPNFLIHLTYHFLLTLVHLAETGQWHRVMSSFKEIIHSESELTEEITSGFMFIARWSPSLPLLWCRLLTLLDFSSPCLWSKILGTSQKSTVVSCNLSDSPSKDQEEKTLCLSLEFLKRAGVLVLSEFAVRHFQEENWLTWILVQHINDVLVLYEELPMQKLLKEVYNSAAASSLLLQAVQTRCHYIHSAEYGNRIVKLLSGVHHDQSGVLVSFLVEQMLPSPLLAISREAASLAAQKLHLLIAEESDRMSPVEIQKLILNMKEENLHKRYGQVFSLLQQLLSLYSEKAEVCLSESTLSVTPASETSLDLNWYLELVSSRCAFGGGGGQECGKLLSHLEYNDILMIMTSKSFNRALLPHTFKYGLTSRTQASTPWSDCSSSIETNGDSEDGCISCPEPPLFTASKVVLTQHLHELEACLPGPHMPYNPGGGSDYSDQLSKMLLSDPLARESIERISSAILQYMDGLQSLPWRTEFHPDEAESLLRFAVVCLEYLHWRSATGGVSISTACSGLSCINTILKNSALANFLSLSGKTSYICSLVLSLHCVVLQFIHPKTLPSLPSRLDESFSSLDGASALACKHITQLILWLECQGEKELPHCLSTPLRGVCQGLGRTTLLNSIVRLPPELWSLGWSPQLSFDCELALPAIPVELLQETDVLKQFIFRIGLLGFVGRHQFEETWMLLLSVLNSAPTLDTPLDQVPFINLSLSLAVQGVTLLLMQSLLIPDPGNPHSSSLLSVVKDMPPTYLDTIVGRKLSNVIRQLEMKLSDVKHILKRQSALPSSYHGGQVSVEYMVAAMISSQSLEDSPSFHLSAGACADAERREKILISCGLDAQSCLHFLHDNLYSLWLQSSMCSSVVAEVVKSISILCDLFTTTAHHKWVLELLVPLHSDHPIEDHITFQYIIMATCKSTAALKMAQQDVSSSLTEGVIHIVEEGLRHAQASVRTCAMQGLLFLLQAPQDGNTFANLAANYVLRHTESKGKESETQTVLLWDLWVYLAEHFPSLPDPTLPSTALHMALTTAASNSTSPGILQRVLSGVERLVLVQQLQPGTVEVVLKLVMDLIVNSSSSVSIASLSLFLTALYSSTRVDSTSFLMTDPETLLQFLEKLQVLFERIRLGYPFEAEVIGEILGTCLLDIMPASQILNKVITEYISSHQPHPHLLASALFQVFEAAINEGGENIVQEWVLLSLSNFTQRTPVSLAVWCLTCFFIAASRDQWLRAAFPSVQARLGKLDPRDIQVFCLAATHFRRNLASDSHRMKFDEVFQAVASPESPFEALISTIRKEDN